MYSSQLSSYTDNDGDKKFMGNDGDKKFIPAEKLEPIFEPELELVGVIILQFSYRQRFLTKWHFCEKMKIT